MKPFLYASFASSQAQVNLKLIVGLVLAGLIVLFTLQNTETVEVSFLFWKWSTPRAVMIFCVLVVGMVIGWILSSWARHRTRDATSSNE